MQSLFPFYEGLTLGLCLQVAIRLQNAFTIKQGTLKNQVFVVALTFWIIDSLFIVLGIGVFGYIGSIDPILLSIVKYGAAIFLTFCGIQSISKAFMHKILYISNDNARISLYDATLIAFSLSILSPHLYINNCALLGSLGGAMTGENRLYFMLGAMLASFLWFLSIGYFAKLLFPIFQHFIFWKIFDLVKGVLMLGIAIANIIGGHP